LSRLRFVRELRQKLIYKNDNRSILVGEKLDLEDPNLNKVVTLINNLINGPSPLNITTAILPHPAIATWPIIRYIFS
jgi:hypothetical protein